MQQAAEINRERFAIKKSYSIENGYPSRRRSLVEDAKFESTIKKQQKQTWIEEARQSFDSEEISEEEVFLVTSSTDPVQNVILILGLLEGLSTLPRIIKTIENFKGKLLHVESRSPKEKGTTFEVFLRLEIEKEPLLNLLKALRQGSSTTYVNLLPDHRTSFKEVWFPRQISDLDHCNHLMTKFEPDLDMDHPGFADKIYRARRKEIADIAFSYRYGEPIPRVEYRQEEVSTWGAVFKELDKLIPTHACKQYIKVWNILKKECGYSPDVIPQLQDVSDFMKGRTGFILRPAAGLLTARDFLASLAFRVFQCTQYVRHHSFPHHSPEPDVIHELLGHAPLLSDPSFAEFSQELGLASLGATDEEIEKFATMYWFTVEFGLCREGKELRAWGAGLLSSFGELQHSLSNKPEHKEFDPSVTAIQPYQDQDYQDLYFVSESIDDAQKKFRKWASTTLKRPYEVRYNAFTQSIILLDTGRQISLFMNEIMLNIEKLRMSVAKLYL
ncbi:UNVERIFIED_CONTAM: hypothetical protein RMT77_013416 [Armadillidium vulgare]